VVSTVAGGGIPVNIPAASAGLPTSPSVAVDAGGNVYFSGFYTVLRMDAVSKILTLVAGNATIGFSGDNGPADHAQLTQPNAVAVDSIGSVYIADGNRIRKVSNGIITTIAGNGTAGSTGDGGPALSAEVAPTGLAFDSSDNLYFTNSVPNMAIMGAHFAHLSTVRRISQGVIATVAGNGLCCSVTAGNVPATSTSLYELTAIAVDGSGNLYFPSTTNTNVGNVGAIYKISAGVITTIAGGPNSLLSIEDGTYNNPPFSQIFGIAVDVSGNLYITDYLDLRVREISNGTIATIAGNGGYNPSGDNGPATSASVGRPEGIAVAAGGNIYFSDFSGRVREISNGIITTAAGTGTFGYGGDNGPATNAQLFLPIGVAVDAAGNLYIADQYNSRIREVSNGIITTVAGNGTQGYSGDNGPATATGLFFPQGVAADSAGNIYIADTADRGVREVSNGVITTMVAGLDDPTQVAVDSAGNVYISDSSCIRKVSGGIITTVAGGNGTPGFGGDGGPATSALLFGSYGIAVDPAGNLYIADAGNNRIRKVSNGIITTVAGNGTPGFSGDNGPATSAELNRPQSVAVDAAGNLYIADTYNYVIRKISNGIITTIAGTGTQGYSGENLPALSSTITPTYLAVDSLGHVFFSEQYAYRVRELKPCTLRLPRGRSAPDSPPCSMPPVFSPR
jgi:sugar lactone lactonase YvrE